MAGIREKGVQAPVSPVAVLLGEGAGGRGGDDGVGGKSLSTSRGPALNGRGLA